MLTVLLVDDDEMMLGFCTYVLAQIPGTYILKAGCALEALEIAARHEGAIDLLVSDISMPGDLNGGQMAEILEAQRPGMKVVLMSGHSPSYFPHRPAWRFLAKPFPAAVLVANVEEVICVQR
jgi:two-component system, cell cycle sensor histidine kinase and response regulator CckA